MVIPCWECLIAMISERGSRLLRTLDNSLTGDECEQAIELWARVFHDRGHRWKDVL